jgi:hypothetical protein
MDSNFNFYVETGRFSARKSPKNDVWTDEIARFLQMIHDGEEFEAVTMAYYYGFGKGLATGKREAKRKERRNNRSKPSKLSHGSEKVGEGKKE